MLRLVRPDLTRYESWYQALLEFDSPEPHGFSTFGFTVEELATPEGFRRWLERDHQLQQGPVDDLVPSHAWWIVDDAEPEVVVGAAQLRMELNDFLSTYGGHVGYGVRPGARGRGVATRTLQLLRDEAAARGLDRLLVTCRHDNEASRRTILANGGVPDGRAGDFLRFWVTT